MDIREYYKILGYTRLTYIQEKSIPLLARRIDTLIIAPTGSGKTEAAMIPIMAILSSNSSKRAGVRALYITPLRSLNRDMLRRITEYAKSFNLTVDVRHGDTSSYRRRKIAENPPDILITTPETLALMLVNKMRDSFKTLEWVIIDEIHELLTNKRGADLTLSLERLEMLSDSKITRVGLSATVQSIDDAARFLVGNGNGRRCAVVKDGYVRDYDIRVVYIGEGVESVASYILDYVKSEYADSSSPSSSSSILLFTNTRDEAEYLASVMNTIADGLSIEVHHGSLSREVREETERRLRGIDTSGGNRYDYDNNNNNNNRTAALVVCTSSLELGIDVGSISTVIHYGSPRQVSKMAQRIGRSMHRAGEAARGLVIAKSIDDELESYAILSRLKRGQIEEQRIHMKPLDVLAHHLAGLALEYGSMDVDKTLSIVCKAYPFKDISIDDLDSCLQLLHDQSIVSYDKKNRVFRAARARKYYYENSSMIPDVLKFDVYDAVNNRLIGSLDQEFVGDYCESGSIFILKGQQWRVISVDYNTTRVNVEPYYASSMNIPYWSGEMIPVDYDTARLVGRIRRTALSAPISDKSRNAILSTLNKLKVIPDERSIVIEARDNLLVIHACFGTRVNNTLAALLSTILSSLLGYVVNTRADAYRIMLTSNTYRISKDRVCECLYGSYDIYSILVASLAYTHNLNWRLWNVAKRYGIVDSNAVYDKKVTRLLYDRYRDTPVLKEALRELLHEKYDIEHTSRVLEDVREGKIKVTWVDVESLSELAEPIVEEGQTYGFKALNDEQGIIKIVHDRLLKTRHRLVCIACGHSKVIEVSNSPDVITCSSCNSRLVAAIHPYDEDTLKAVMLRIKHSRLDDEQEYRFRRAWKSASLVQTFGRRALLVLSGHGIGVDTAARILKYECDDDTLVKYVYEAEMQYIRTRGFWDD
jgi:ATP-dependent Lhr-like helicase